MKKLARFFDLLTPISVWGILCGSLALPSSLWAQTIPGQPIVDFDLSDLNGRFHSANQYRGKVLVLFFLGHD